MAALFLPHGFPFIFPFWREEESKACDAELSPNTHSGDAVFLPMLMLVESVRSEAGVGEPAVPRGPPAQLNI